MKKFSKSWKSSKDPGKQRKYKAQSPHHIKHTFLSAHLSKELRILHKHRSLPIRKGDTVKIMRGNHKGKSGVVERVNTKRFVAYINGIEMTKRDGSKSFIPTITSNVLITALTEDKRRFKKIGAIP
ncbi:MAG: 50S ribosomal protein L24 [Nanoarchaeota archaeon]